jgi:hypothetical protein
MTYTVKTLYPEFKCLTTFRKVMKRIPTFRKTGVKFDPRRIKDWWCCVYTNVELMDIEWEAQEFNRLYQMFRFRKQDEQWKKVREDFEDEDLIRLFPENYRVNRFGEIVFAYDRVKKRWMWEEQKKYDTMAKKWEFQQAMISRDYKATTLCDDVIGLVFEYL